ncbi:MAG: hypothetical protein JXQ90_22805 [Cyclobacteriaceae bacterium]
MHTNLRKHINFKVAIIVIATVINGCAAGYIPLDDVQVDKSQIKMYQDAYKLENAQIPQFSQGDNASLPHVERKQSLWVRIFGEKPQDQSDLLHIKGPSARLKKRMNKRRSKQMASKKWPIKKR